MIIDESKTLILQYNDERSEWEDITSRVQWFEPQNNACRIKYVGNSTFYWKSWRDLKIFTNPRNLNLTGKIVYCDKFPVYGLSRAIAFDTYVKLFYATKFTKVVKKSDIKIVSDITENKEIRSFINYLKEVAVLMPTEDGHNFLLNQLDKLTVIEDSVLGKFLQGKLSSEKYSNVLIYPFATNASQRVAIKRALEEDLSIIQGPPGTGKTETIRNIVANYVARGGAVAVLSGNNEATRNVKDKFESTGFGYLNAFLGNTKNVEAFFESKPTPIKIDKELNTTNCERRLRETSDDVETYLKYSLDIAKAVQLMSEYEVEKEINDAEYHIKERTVPKALKYKKYTSAELLELASILETLPKNKITGFINRVRFLFRFGIIKLKGIAQNKDDSIEYLKNKYYCVKISELNKEKAEKQDFINTNNLAKLLDEQKDLSISVFKSCLQERYSEEVLNQERSILRDLAKYYEYYCNETKVLKTSVFSVFDLMYDDYAPILEKTKKNLLNISSFSSENIIATVIDEICKSGECGALGYKFNYPLKYVIKTNNLSDPEDVKFVSNINTHCDFLIYNQLNKEIEMVVEVDGSQHREEVQANRDTRKDRLLSNAGIKVLRLSTTTIECKEKILALLKTN